MLARAVSAADAAAVIGVSVGCLDALSASLFAQASAIDPGPFRGSIPVGTLGVTSASWVVGAAPVFALSPSSDERAWLQGRLAARLGDHPLAAAAARHVAEEEVVIAMSAPSCTATLELDDGTTIPLPGSFTTYLHARTAPGLTIVVEAVASRFVPVGPVQPGLQWVIDNIVVPQLQSVVNQAYASGFAFDLFANAPVPLSPPGITVDGDWLLAFSAPGPDVPAPPPVGSRWPSQTGFAVATRALWQATIQRYLQAHNTYASGSTKIKIGPVKLTAQYSAGLTTIVPGSPVGGGLDGSGQVGGSGSIKVDIPLVPDFTVGVGITASPTFQLQLARSGQTLELVPVSMGSLNLDITLFGVPKIITDLVGKILDFLAQGIGPLVIGLIDKFFKQPTVTLPTEEVQYGDATTSWSIDAVGVAACTDASGVAWLGLTGAPEVSAAPVAQHEPSARKAES
jgi:hypothetical protein